MADYMSDCLSDCYWYYTYYLSVPAPRRHAAHTTTLLAPVLTILCSCIVCACPLYIAILTQHVVQSLHVVPTPVVMILPTPHPPIACLYSQSVVYVSVGHFCVCGYVCALKLFR